jgi:transcriptional regulator with XRE-family HTH domain
MLNHAAMATVAEAPKKNTVYQYVGQRIKERRKLLKFNQAQLAELMGFSYQQMQKYESGSSQISVSRLLQFARVLNVPATYFYEGVRLEDSIGKEIESNIVQRTRTKPLNILLVENSSGEILQFKRVLSTLSEQVDVNVIHDAEHVLDFLIHHHSKYGRARPDVIILETLLSKNGGSQLVRSVRRMPQFLHIPIIVFTNSISKQDMMECYAQGVAGFIQKSADIQEYISTLDLMIRYWAKVVTLPNM